MAFWALATWAYSTRPQPWKQGGEEGGSRVGGHPRLAACADEVPGKGAQRTATRVQQVQASPHDLCRTCRKRDCCALLAEVIHGVSLVQGRGPSPCWSWR
jgi:hypothetical protein